MRKLAHILELADIKVIIERKAHDLRQPMSFFLSKAGVSQAQWDRGGDFEMLLEVARQAGVEIVALESESGMPWQAQGGPRPARRSAGGLYDHVLDPVAPPCTGEIVAVWR